MNSTAMKRAALLLTLCATAGTATLGCRGEDAAQSLDATSTGQAAILDGTPESVGVLGFLNAPTTTFLVLDEQVPLDRRAAENLIAHRDGADGVPGTADDNPFDDIAEVDDVPYVGPATLAKLLAFARAEGFVPEGEDLLGVFDNVAFTVNEATATLALVNTATYDHLDVELALDRRAVDSIFAARELKSLLQLSELYYVGQSAMLKLRDAAYSGPLKGLSEECTAHLECESGLCAGLTLRDYGWCMEPWTAGDFASSTSVGIPDDGTAVTSSIDVAGLASVPLDVSVTLDITHPRKQDLVVVLHQPGGASGVLWDHEANPPSFIGVAPGVEGDNMVNGEWILEVTDTVTGESGTIHGWSMWISSNWD